MNSSNLYEQYEGGAFYSEFVKGKSSGSIHITNQALVFVAEAGQVELPLNGLQIRLGGASNRLIFFSHSSKPDWSVYTPDHTVLRDARFTALRHTAAQIAQIRLRKKYTRLALSGVAFLVIGLIYGLFWLKEPIVIAIAKRVPLEWERQLGEMVYAQSIIGRTLIEDEEIVDELERLTSPLLQAIDDNRYEFRLHILADPTLNAFAIPGGHVVIHTGLILNADTPEEVVGILAHEVAHVTGQHSIRQIISSAGLVLLVQAFFGDASGILALITQRSALLLTQKFSRDHEREADEVGWNYLLKANVNPEGMITFFEKLRAESEKSGLSELEESLNFLSTHPATEERITRLKEKQQSEEESDFIQFEIDFDVVQGKVRHYQSKRKETTNESRD